MKSEQYDVVVVGSGAGGATAACTLALNGLTVCLIEEGPFVSREQFSNTPSTMISKLYRDAGGTAIIGTPNIQYIEGRCVGGSTVVNGGMCWRTPEKVLHCWTEELDDPSFSPERILPFFEEVEKENNVAEQDPESLGKDNLLFHEIAQNLDWGIRANLRNQKHCAGSNNCIIGCPTGAKQSALESYIPRFIEAGGVLLPETKVVSVQHNHGKVSGIFYTRKNQPFRDIVKAKSVILAGGSSQTPLILWRSRLANPHLGRHLFLHPTLKTVGIYDRELTMWKGVHQAHQVTEFLDREGIMLASGSVPPSILALGIPGFGKTHGTLMEQYNNMLVIGVMIEDTNTGRLRNFFGNPFLTYSITKKDVDNVKKALGYAIKMHITGGAKQIILPLHGLQIIDSSEVAKRFENYQIKPGELEMMSVHLMGTCRMGRHDDLGVVDTYGRVFGSSNLFVCDASVFPTHLGVNPMQTIWTLAKRTSYHLLENRKKYLIG